MTTAVVTPPARPADKLWTIEEFEALPDEPGVDRWLLNGRLYERRDPELTKRHRFHSALMSRLGQLIGNWIDTQPEPRGEVYTGEAGVYLRRSPDVAVGVDVAYLPPGVVATQTDETTMIDGVPALVVELLSPSNPQGDVDDKVVAYLAAGVPLVWVVSPRFQTVTVYRPGVPPELFNVTHTLDADPHLPGFSVPVVRLFRRP